MPREKLSIGKRHARRIRKKNILTLMSCGDDDSTSCFTKESTLSSDTEIGTFAFENSIEDPSSSNLYTSDDFQLPLSDAYECESDRSYPIDDVQTSSNSFFLSENLTFECNVAVGSAVFENSDYNDSDETHAENDNPSAINLQVEESDYELCSSVDSSEDSDIDEDSTDETTYRISVNTTVFQESFRNVMIKHNATLALTTDLLHLLNSVLPFLPLDGRTILKTPKSTETARLTNGEFCYFGLETCIVNKLKGCVLPAGHPIELDFNIDGLPLFKSSSTEFWPILGRISSIDDQDPFAVGIFCGRGKPDPQEVFLNHFIDEVNTLQKNGIKHDNLIHEVKVRCFSCDAPARSWLKCVKAHSAKAGCERCEALAIVRNKKLFYPTTYTDYPKRQDNHFQSGVRDGESRTNERYDKSKDQATHITGKSPLLKILFLGLVTQFILDPMHLVYLGVVKRLALKYWICGKRPFKLSMQNLKTVNEMIRTIRSYIPPDFARKGRNLLEIKRFKATEFRLIILYTGPIFLRDVLTEDKYSHFLLLHAAITILSSENHIARYTEIAKDALKRFVIQAARIYGEEFVVYNVHSLLHIADDVENYGPLESYSCFAFENYLKTLKYRVRAKTCPLQQISNRIQEINAIQKPRESNDGVKYYPVGKTQPVAHQPEEQYFECTSLRCPRFKISSKRADNVVSVNGTVYVIRKIFCIYGQYKCIGTSFRWVEDLYEDPLPSTRLDIFHCRGSGDTSTFSVEQISFKWLMIPFKEGFAIFPILHQLSES